MSNKFKVGDIVRVLDFTKMKPCGCVEAMENYIGTEHKVVRIVFGGSAYELEDCEIRGFKFAFHEDVLELVYELKEDSKPTGFPETKKEFMKLCVTVTDENPIKKLLEAIPMFLLAFLMYANEIAKRLYGEGEES